MMTSDESRYVSQRFDVIYEQVRAKWQPVIRDALARWIDDCYMRGHLPLPPFGCLREPWYLGDLR